MFHTPLPLISIYRLQFNHVFVSVFTHILSNSQPPPHTHSSHAHYLHIHIQNPNSSQIVEDIPDDLLQNYDDDEDDDIDEATLRALMAGGAELEEVDEDEDEDLQAEDEDGLLPHEYDYTQHLKPMGQGKFIAGINQDLNLALEARAKEALQIPEDMFASKEEEKLGLLERSVDVKGATVKATQDFFQALDIDSENEDEFEELEDNFFDLAMESADEEDEEEKEVDRIRALPINHQLKREELDKLDEVEREARKQRFLDDHFEAMMNQYDDEDIGELEEDDPELEGHIEGVEEHYDDLLEHFRARNERNYRPNLKRDQTAISEAKKLLEARLEVMAKEDAELTDEKLDAKIKEQFPERIREQWDVETVLTLQTDTENHPSVIREPRRNIAKEIKLSKKTGIPLGVLPERTRREEEFSDDEYVEVENLGEARKKGETKEEKKARKAAMKALKREKRERKKALKTMYKEQEAIHDKHAIKQKESAQGSVRM